MTARRIWLAAFLVLVGTNAVRAQGTPTTIVVLGDSITKAVRPGVTAEQTFGAILEAKLKAEGKSVRVLNKGIGGERTDQALARLDATVLNEKPVVVTIMYGSNDSYVDKGKAASRITREQYRANLVELIKRFRKIGATPILMTPTCTAENAGKNGLGESPNIRLEDFVKACREVAKAENVRLVDHFDLWTAAAKKRGKLADRMTDGVHPNPEGQAILADAILPAVRDALAKGEVR